MKKHALGEFGINTAEHVIAHAKWQSARGRRPSMPFRGEKNPQKALKMAQSILSVHEVTVIKRSASACKHGNVGFCGFCMSENAPRCKHGHPYYCGFCGPIN